MIADCSRLEKLADNKIELEMSDYKRYILTHDLNNRKITTIGDCMRNKNIDNLELTKLQQEIVALTSKGYTTSELEAKLSLKRRDLIKEYYRLLISSKEFLSEKNYQFILTEYLANCCFKEFPEGKIAFISDAHIASKHENLEYLRQVKEFLIENDIEYLLDGGDIGDGMVEPSKKYQTYEQQLDHILDSYDLGSIKQYILGGNHDAKYKRKNPSYDILSLLEENNRNIEAVGYYQAYFKLGKNVISFQHNSYYNKSFMGRDFSILGHAHYLSYKDSTVILPTLSDSFPNSLKPKHPGFLVLEINTKNDCTQLEFTNYFTTKDGIEKGKIKKYQLR